MSREAFLARVRQAAQAGRAYRVHLHAAPEGVSYVGAREADLCAALAAEVNEVGGFAQVVNDFPAAADALGELLTQYEIASALAWQHPVLDRLGLGKLLSDRGVELWTYDSLASLAPQEQRAKALAAGIGITSADYAVAETGTLVVCARPGQERMASLLPPVHVAVIEQAQILPDLLNAFADIQAGGTSVLPSNISLITGPSKTGDIELQLTTGVHGPGRWHVIVVRSGSAS